MNAQDKRKTQRRQPGKSLGEMRHQEEKTWGRGYGRMMEMEMERKICLWQEKETKPPHYWPKRIERWRWGGGIKVENVLRPKEEKMGVEEEIKRKYFGFWYVYTEADHRYSDFITAWQQHILECTVTQAVPGSAEHPLLEESAGSSNEQQTLRIANKLTCE